MNARITQINYVGGCTNENGGCEGWDAGYNYWHDRRRNRNEKKYDR
jgi:hypothetical protein